MTNPLKRLWLKFFPPAKKPLWQGKCSCCGVSCRSYTRTFTPNEELTLECLGCQIGWTEASKKRIADRHQIELMKTAMRELKEES